MHLTRIMYVENKSAEPANQTGRGPARIGRVVFSKSRQSVCYRGKTLQRSKSGYKWNYFEIESGERYWVSGPKRNGADGLYGYRATPIDEDAREEYWVSIRRQPQHSSRKFS